MGVFANPEAFEPAFFNGAGQIIRARAVFNIVAEEA
jgi:hypothetical protein